MHVQMATIITFHGGSYPMSGGLMETTPVQRFAFSLVKTKMAPHISYEGYWGANVLFFKLSLNLRLILKAPVLSPGNCLYSLARKAARLDKTIPHRRIREASGCCSIFIPAGEIKLFCYLFSYF